MQVVTVTSCIRRVSPRNSVLPSCSNWTALELGRMVATANAGCWVTGCWDDKGCGESRPARENAKDIRVLRFITVKVSFCIRPPGRFYRRTERYAGRQP